MKSDLHGLSNAVNPAVDRAHSVADLAVSVAQVVAEVAMAAGIATKDMVADAVDLVRTAAVRIVGRDAIVVRITHKREPAKAAGNNTNNTGIISLDTSRVRVIRIPIVMPTAKVVAGAVDTAMATSLDIIRMETNHVSTTASPIKRTAVGIRGLHPLQLRLA
jgi:hypothetical protein